MSRCMCIAATAVLVASAGAGASLVPIVNRSFESGIGSLPNPALNPPLSGTIGGWDFSRSAAIVSGATVPAMGIQASANATDGSNVAFVQFAPGVVASGVISQDLAAPVQVTTRYTLIFDVIPMPSIPLPPSIEVRLLGGGGLLVSSTDPTHVVTVNLPSGATRYVMRVETGVVLDSPGQLSIELHSASTLSIVAGAQFDNIVLDARPLGGCYPNCDGSSIQPILNANDFQCFLNAYATAQSEPEAIQVVDYANCDESVIPPVLNANDFQCFTNAFAAGCP